MIDRSTYIGASDIGAIAGLSPYAGPLDVWARKKGLTHFAGNEATERGNRLEKSLLGGGDVARRYGIKTDYPIETIVLDGQPFGATLDAVEDDRRPLEFKTTTPHSAHMWGDDGSDLIPAHYAAQVQWQIMIARESGLLDADSARVVVWGLDDSDYRSYEIPSDESRQLLLAKLARNFWRYMQGDTPPPATAKSDDTVLALFPSAQSADFITACAEANALIAKYKELSAQAKSANDARSEVANRLKMLIGDHAGIKGDAGTASWKDQAGSVSWKKVCDASGADAETIKKFQSKGTRVLRVK